MTEQVTSSGNQTEARRSLRTSLGGLTLIVCVACESGKLVTLGQAPVEVQPPNADDEITLPDPTVTPSVPSRDAGPSWDASLPAEDADASPTPPEPTAPREAAAPLPDPVSEQDATLEDAGPIEAPPLPEASTADAGTPLESFDFDEPAIVTELDSAVKDDNPTLTADLLQIYFTSSRGDNTDIWWASRSSPDTPFDEPQPVEALNTSGFDASPAVEADGLTLWFSRERDEEPNDLEIWVARRDSLEDAWGEPELAVELNSDFDDIARPTGAGGLLMPLASRREQDTYLTYFAQRATLDDSFDAPRLATELVVDGANTVDAFLTNDGLTLLYSHSTDESGDLFVASRAGLSEEFSNERPLDSLNTTADDRDPWLSPDGSVLFFASDRDGALTIYQARRRR